MENRRSFLKKGLAAVIGRAFKINPLEIISVSVSTTLATTGTTATLASSAGGFDVIQTLLFRLLNECDELGIYGSRDMIGIDLTDITDLMRFENHSFEDAFEEAIVRENQQIVECNQEIVDCIAEYVQVKKSLGVQLNKVKEAELVDKFSKIFTGEDGLTSEQAKTIVLADERKLNEFSKEFFVKAKENTAKQHSLLRGNKEQIRKQVEEAFKNNLIKCTFPTKVKFSATKGKFVIKVENKSKKNSWLGTVVKSRIKTELDYGREQYWRGRFQGSREDYSRLEY